VVRAASGARDVVEHGTTPLAWESPQRDVFDTSNAEGHMPRASRSRPHRSRRRDEQMNAKTTNADKAARSTKEEAERVGGAISGLVQAWINAGTQLAVGTTRAIATGIDDLSRVYCRTGTEKDDEKGTLAAPCISLAKSVEDCASELTRSVDEASKAIRSACQPVADACGSAAKAAGEAVSGAGSDTKSSSARAEGSSG
jgi:hypothetical protein